jgi:hypothetical protein
MVGGPPVVTVALIFQAIRAARQHPDIAAIVLAVAFLLFGPPGPKRLRITGDRAREIGGVILGGAMKLIAMREEALQKLTTRLVPGVGNETVGAVVAALIQEREPVAFEDLVARLSGTLDEGQATEILDGWPLFMEVSEGYWQLGRRVRFS